MISYRSKRLITSFFKRLSRWEFWPIWFFYIPVVVYIIGLTIRHRSLAFTAVNPGMEGSGVIGERKSDCLLHLQAKNSLNTAKTHLIEQSLPLDQQITQLDSLIQTFGFPIILKPDYGQRGIDVKIIKTRSDAIDYLKQADYDTVLQEYISGVEFGVFYTRLPDNTEGQLFSTTHKCFPSVEGDGSSSVETLILQHQRLYYMGRYLLNNLDPQLLATIPTLGEKVQVITIGSHCRGSLFLEGKQYLTDTVKERIEEASQQLPEFYFGRYDIRAASIESFARGEFKIIEVNGVTSEPTHIYDPKYSLWMAYKTLFKQWRLAYLIGSQNMARGFQAMTLLELIGKVRIMNRETPKKLLNAP